MRLPRRSSAGSVPIISSPTMRSSRPVAWAHRGYRLQMSTVTIDDQQQPLTDPFTGVPITNPETGEPVVSHQREATAQNNVIYLDDVPVFYWPYIATDLSDSTYYISRAVQTTASSACSSLPIGICTNCWDPQ